MRSNINQRSSETASLASEGSPQNNGRIKQPKRTIIVEPLLVISALSTVPLVILTQQYVFQQEAKLVAIKHGISNYTIPPTSENPCGNPTSEQNRSSPLANFTEEIQAATSKFVIYSNLAASLPALLVTLFLGAYSDQAGRRYAILPPLLSSFAKVAVYVYVVLADLPVNYLLIGSFVDGFGGGYATLLLGCFAYLADITLPEQRAFRITVAEFCMFASLTLPPLAVGFWIQKSGYLLPFVVVFVGQLLAVLYAVFLVPETVIRNPDARFLTTSHLKDAAAVFTMDHGTNRRLKLNLMLLAFFFYMLVGLGSWQVNSLFQMNHPLCWNSKIIGIFAAVYIIIAVVGGMTASRLLKRWMSDDMLCLVACIVFTFQHLYLGFVKNTGMMLIGKESSCIFFIEFDKFVLTDL